MQYFPLKLVILHKKLAIFIKNMGTGEKIQKLIQRLKSNDAEAFHELYNSFAPVLYRYLYSLLHSKEDTEDILHNVFCKLWEMRGQLRENANLEAFLITVSKNSAYNLFKSKYYNSILNESLLDKNIADIANCSKDNINGENDVIGHDLDNYLGKIIENLPPRRKEIFILNRFKGLSYKEIAEHLKISENTVDTQMRKAVAFIKEHLSNELVIIILTALKQTL